VLATYDAQKDFILIGAYKKGSDRRTDYAIAKIDAVNAFLRQGIHDPVPARETFVQLQGLF
jgi:flagellar biosynthesis/type III secretory pathway ATPase